VPTMLDATTFTMVDLGGFSGADMALLMEWGGCGD
jgi:hypothetical protein